MTHELVEGEAPSDRERSRKHVDEVLAAGTYATPADDPLEETRDDALDQGEEEGTE